MPFIWEVFSLQINIFIKKKKTFSEFRYFMENCGMMARGMLRTTEGSFDLRASLYLSEVLCFKFFL